MMSAVKNSSAAVDKNGKSKVKLVEPKKPVVAAVKQPTKMQRAKEKADRTWKMANTLAKALIRRHSRRWQCVDFLGEGGRESAGIVDILAIKKSGKAPGVEGLKKLDLFEIMLIQVKGGDAKEPSAEDIARMRLVAEHYHASKVLLFQWKKGTKQTGFRVLNDNNKFGAKEVDASVLFKDVSRASSKVGV